MLSTVDTSKSTYPLLPYPSSNPLPVSHSPDAASNLLTRNRSHLPAIQIPYTPSNRILTPMSDTYPLLPYVRRTPPTPLRSPRHKKGGWQCVGLGGNAKRNFVYIVQILLLPSAGRSYIHLHFTFYLVLLFFTFLIILTFHPPDRGLAAWDIGGPGRQRSRNE